MKQTANLTGLLQRLLEHSRPLYSQGKVADYIPALSGVPAERLGIADKTERGLSSEQLLVNADIALYEAKRRGRNRVERFNDQLRARTINIKHTADVHYHNDLEE